MVQKQIAEYQEVLPHDVVEEEVPQVPELSCTDAQVAPSLEQRVVHDAVPGEKFILHCPVGGLLQTALTPVTFEKELHV